MAAIITASTLYGFQRTHTYRVYLIRREYVPGRAEPEFWALELGVARTTDPFGAIVQVVKQIEAKEAGANSPALPAKYHDAVLQARRYWSPALQDRVTLKGMDPAAVDEAVRFGSGTIGQLAMQAFPFFTNLAKEA